MSITVVTMRGLVARDQLQQIPTGCRLLGLQAAGGERVPELLVQVDAVGHQHDARIRDVLSPAPSALASMTMVSDLPQPCVCQITPPCRRPSLSRCLHPLDDLAHGEELLIARDLLDAEIEQREAAGQIEQPVGAAERSKQPILLGQLAAARPS